MSEPFEFLDYRQWDALGAEEQIKRIKKEKALAEKMREEKGCKVCSRLHCMAYKEICTGN